MTKPLPDVPKHLRRLGEELEPIRDLLRDGLLEAPAAAEATLEPRPDRIERHLDRAIEFTQDVIDLLEEQLLPLLSGGGKGKDRKSLAQHLRKLVRTQLRRYHALDASGRADTALDLLARIYRHNLEELEQWLEDFVNATLYPFLYRTPRQLPNVTLDLSFTPAPEIDELESLMSRETGSPCPTMWQTLGAVVIGAVIADVLFEND